MKGPLTFGKTGTVSDLRVQWHRARREDPSTVTGKLADEAHLAVTMALAHVRFHMLVRPIACRMET